MDGGLIPDSNGNTNVGVGSFLQYDGLGNIFTYVEGEGYFWYQDPSATTAPIPEPSTWALLGLGLGALLLRFRRSTGRMKSAPCL